ncbi:MAG TPA: hypothetical protein VF398_04750 [bacterium]|jgi:hypothetical protein
MGRLKKRAPEVIKCKSCRAILTPEDKPYHSKQVGLEGVYHWVCFIEACKNRVPVSIGAFEPPLIGSGGGSTEEREVESAPATVEE